MTTLLVLALSVAFTLLVAVIVHSARRGVLGSGALASLAALSAVALLAMNLTDWPLGLLDEFWREHSVIAATLCTLLLAGAGFLAFEARENLEQTRATESLATAAFGGLVDHMLDVDLALATLRRADPPAGMRTDGRPLRWLREQRYQLVGAKGCDPRLADQTEWEDGAHDRWRDDLLDQAVRRVMAAMRDWAPLLTQTRDGTGVLVRVGHLRNHLLAAQRAVRDQRWSEARRHVRVVRAECQVLALGLELGSGVPVEHLRAGVLKHHSRDLDGHGSATEMTRLVSFSSDTIKRRRIGALLAAGGRSQHGSS